MRYEHSANGNPSSKTSLIPQGNKKPPYQMSQFLIPKSLVLMNQNYCLFKIFREKISLWEGGGRYLAWVSLLRQVLIFQADLEHYET